MRPCASTMASQQFFGRLCTPLSTACCCPAASGDSAAAKLMVFLRQECQGESLKSCRRQSFIEINFRLEVQPTSFWISGVLQKEIKEPLRVYPRIPSNSQKFPLPNFPYQVYLWQWYGKCMRMWIQSKPCLSPVGLIAFMSASVILQPIAFRFPLLDEKEKVPEYWMTVANIIYNYNWKPRLFNMEKWKQVQVVSGIVQVSMMRTAVFIAARKSHKCFGSGTDWWLFSKQMRVVQRILHTYYTSNQDECLKRHLVLFWKLSRCFFPWTAFRTDHALEKFHNCVGAAVLVCECPCLWNCFWHPHTVDGRNPAPVEVGSSSHYLRGFLHPRSDFFHQQY